MSQEDREQESGAASGIQYEGEAYAQTIRLVSEDHEPRRAVVDGEDKQFPRSHMVYNDGTEYSTDFGQSDRFAIPTDAVLKLLEGRYVEELQQQIGDFGDQLTLTFDQNQVNAPSVNGIRLEPGTALVSELFSLTRVYTDSRSMRPVATA